MNMNRQWERWITAYDSDGYLNHVLYDTEDEAKNECLGRPCEGKETPRAIRVLVIEQLPAGEPS